MVVFNEKMYQTNYEEGIFDIKKPMIYAFSREGYRQRIKNAILTYSGEQIYLDKSGIYFEKNEFLQKIKDINSNDNNIKRTAQNFFITKIKDILQRKIMICYNIDISIIDDVNILINYNFIDENNVEQKDSFKFEFNKSI